MLGWRGFGPKAEGSQVLAGPHPCHPSHRQAGRGTLQSDSTFMRPRVVKDEAGEENAMFLYQPESWREPGSCLQIQHNIHTDICRPLSHSDSRAREPAGGCVSVEGLERGWGRGCGGPRAWVLLRGDPLGLLASPGPVWRLLRFKFCYLRESPAFQYVQGMG